MGKKAGVLYAPAEERNLFLGGAKESVGFEALTAFHAFCANEWLVAHGVIP